MAFATKSSDSFNRSDGALGGSTLDNAAGGSEAGNTWTVLTGTWAITSNQCEHDAGTTDDVAYVGSTGNVADQRVTITRPTSSGTDMGAIARWTAGTGGNGNFYLAFIDASGNAILYKYTDGSGFTQLGSTGSAVAIGDEIGVQCVGNQISLLINGSVNIGPITDSAHTTGKPGIYGGEADRFAEDFLYETDEVVGGDGVFADATALLTYGRLFRQKRPTGLRAGVSATQEPDEGVPPPSGGGDLALQGNLYNAPWTD